MISSLVPALISAFKVRRELALENVTLREQLAVLHHSVNGRWFWCRVTRSCARV